MKQNEHIFILGPTIDGTLIQNLCNWIVCICLFPKDRHGFERAEPTIVKELDFMRHFFEKNEIFGCVIKIGGHIFFHKNYDFPIDTLFVYRSK